MQRIAHFKGYSYLVDFDHESQTFVAKAFVINALPDGETKVVIVTPISEINEMKPDAKAQNHPTHAPRRRELFHAQPAQGSSAPLEPQTYQKVRP
jgi:hypothetical protein